jgi:cell division protease FtsH
LLKKNKSKLTQLADRLLEKEVIFKDDLLNILGERPFDVKPNDKEEGPQGVPVPIN